MNPTLLLIIAVAAVPIAYLMGRTDGIIRATDEVRAVLDSMRRNLAGTEDTEAGSIRSQTVTQLALRILTALKAIQ